MVVKEKFISYKPQLTKNGKNIRLLCMPMYLHTSIYAVEQKEINIFFKSNYALTCVTFTEKQPHINYMQLNTC